ncbi:restriction endonuclease [Exiguobacterium sp. KRL4]|uniref:restriction endonuclease n=1 Tax=Exiguobacterium sp. KRL4 TaxID=1914536 RepID=UPI0009F1E480|nr:restriction endonuclease [Exiguobacterium sp. KRL4]
MMQKRTKRRLIALLFAFIGIIGSYFFSSSWEPLILIISIVGCTLFLILSFLTPSLANRLDRMEGREFEEWLVELFETAGYRVELTPASRDFGADLLIEDAQGYRIAIQAKRYGSAVGLEAVQQVAAAVPFYDMDEGWVVTNSSYTEAAYRLAEPNRVRLIDRNELLEFAHEIGFR